MRGRRGHKYTSLLVGLAREAMGRGEMLGNRSPFSYSQEELNELPKLMQKKLHDFAVTEVERALLSHGMPKTVSEEDVAQGLTLEDRT